MKPSSVDFAVFQDEDVHDIPDELHLCSLQCGRKTRSGLDRFLRRIETCCDRCRDSKGTKHDDACERNSATVQAHSNSAGMASLDGSDLLPSSSLIHRVNDILATNPTYQGPLTLQNARCLVSILCQSNGFPCIDEKRLVLLFSRFAVASVIPPRCSRAFFYTVLRRIQKMAQAVESTIPLPRYFFVMRGTKLSKYYKFKSVLGQGSFGIVHRVLHIPTGQERVCKSISKGASSVPAHQIESEIRIIAQLDHPNVIKVFEYFEDEQHVHLIMEYCNGGDLMKRIKEAITSKASLPLNFVRKILRQILSSLAFMSNNRVIHKDLKPENVMLVGSRAGVDDSVVKVIDFGLSELFSKDQQSSTTVAGTAFYMAPEIFRPPFNDKCDVWSCGVIAFFMLSGFLPYFGATVAEVKSNVLYRKLQWPSSFAGCSARLDVPQQARDLVERMLDKDAKSRIDAHQALSHPWFNEGASDPGSSATARVLSSAVMQNISLFGKMTLLKRATLNLIAHIWNFAEAENIRAVFMELDTKNRGFITISQLASVLEANGASSMKAWKLAQAVDVSGTGSITFSAMTAAIIFPLIDTDKRIVSSAYNAFGMNRKGSISVTGMWELFGGSKTSFPRLKHAIEYSDFLELVRSEIKVSEEPSVSRHGKSVSACEGIESDDSRICFTDFKDWLLNIESTTTE